MVRALQTMNWAEPKNTSDVFSDIDDHGDYNREMVTIEGAHGVLGIGTVLGLVTATLKYAPLDPTANDGRQTAVALLLHKVDTTAGDVASATIIARHSEAKIPGLEWLPAVTDAQKIVAIRQLKAVGIVARPGA